MNIGGFNTQLSPDDCHLAIDGVAKETVEREDIPSYLSANDSAWFKPVDGAGDSYIWDEWSGIPAFQKTGDQEEIYVSNTYLGNQKTIVSQKWTHAVPVSDEAMRADQHGRRAAIGAGIGNQARLDRDKNAILETYADAFAGSVNTTPDGQPLASASHVTLNGDTVDNLETAALDADGLWTCVNTLAELKGQNGEVASYNPFGILVPFTLYKTVKETLGSPSAPLVPFSAENQLNIFETQYGEMSIKASVFLNASQNSATNAATSYHVMSKEHNIARKAWYGLMTEFVEAKYSDNDTHMIKSKFNEIAFPESWYGGVHSNGTT